MSNKNSSKIETEVEVNVPKPKPKTNVILFSILIILVSILIFVFLGSIIFMWMSKSSAGEAPKPQAQIQQKPEAPKPPSVCETPECITLAYQMLNWGDNTINPCDNFYQYTCGKYSEHMPAPAGPVWKKRTVDNTITEFLAKNASTTSKSEASIKQLYWRCRERSARNNNSDVFPDILKSIETIGKWPMLLGDEWKDADFDLNSYLENMGKLGMTGLAILQGRPRSVVHQVVLHLDFRFLDLKMEIIEEVVSLITAAGKTPNKSAIEQELKNVRKFARNLKKLLDTKNQNPSSNFNISNSIVDFDRIIKAWQSPYRKSDWKKIKDNLDLAFFSKYAEKWEKLIKTTPKAVLANSLILRMIIHTLGITSFSSDMKCGKFAISNLPRAATRIFVRNFFDKQNIALISEVVEGVKAEYLRMFNESTWLHPNTKKAAIRKMEKMRQIIGYPEEYEVEGALDAIYEKSLPIDPSDSIFDFMVKIIRFRMEQDMEGIATASTFEINNHLVDPNAFYSDHQNLFVVLTPFMDEPFFDATFPKYARLARIGSVIGHEIGHGFDPDGAKFDEDGRNNSWWTSEDLKEFQKRSKCLIDQYEAYDDPSYGRNLNGTLTIQENAADLIGLTALWGYFEKLDMSKEQHIVGVHDYSFEKIYYHLIALNYCSSFETESLESRQTDNHGVSNFRVNGIFSNLKSFSDAFNCPLGSAMNPKEKCAFY